MKRIQGALVSRMSHPVVGATLVAFFALTQAEPVTSQVAAADPHAPQDIKSKSEPIELERYARDLHAFGTYYDSSDGEFVIAVPLGIPIPTDVAAALMGKARIDHLDLTHETANDVRRSIAERTFHPQAKNYSYASWVDLKSGRVVVQSNAPTDVLEPLRNRFKNKIDFRTGGIVVDTG